MGTNVYYLSKNKDAVLKHFGNSYELTDFPYLAYEIHVMKRSSGWLPLWQSHENCRSVKDYKAAYDSGFFEIFDEYGTQYTWEDFYNEFAMFNGGIYGVAPREKIEQDPNSYFYDPNMPDTRPISHFEYANGRYSSDYYTDPQGYEFTIHEFS